MDERTAQVLACPTCHGEFQRHRIRRQDGQIASGRLVCEGCEVEFPIVQGRPLLVPPGAPQQWMTPMDEVLGWEGPPRNEERIFEWIAQNGVDEAIRRAQVWAAQSDEPVPRPEGGKIAATAVSSTLRNKARYRMSGRWFQTVRTDVGISDGVNLRSWALEYPRTPIPDSAEDRQALDEVAYQVGQLRPQRVLDIATGGGHCVSRTLANLPAFDLAVAIDRDQVDTMWSVQYKFSHLGLTPRAESIGGDARALPLRSEAFDVATCHGGFYEVAGVTRMLAEAYRVLRPSGRLVLTGACREHRILDHPDLHEPHGLSLTDVCRFIEAADLHHLDLDQFHARVATVGFEQESMRLYDDGEYFVAALRK